MKNSILLAMVAMVSGNVFASYDHTTTSYWNKRPIPVSIQTGEERLLHFDDNVSVGLPEYLKSKVSVTALAGTVYITSNTEFPVTRLLIQKASNGERIVLDVNSVPEDVENNNGDIHIVTKADMVSEEVKSKVKDLPSVTIKQLVQFASQDVYGPLNARSNYDGIIVSDVKQQYDLSLFVTGRSTGLFNLIPLKEYKTRDYVLTSILVENTSSTKQEVNLYDFYPDYDAIAIQNGNIAPKGVNGDATVIYVINEGIGFLHSEVYR
ncbi:TIGR03749 family integrating conjugative element protein [Vibrio barjaei]|uniref:TIGR03749 family integrating conjugative element protein n=1 Tax=Vibrio barjaei TaxID=1676683 RepID=UPI00228430C4|nr:TIGR03749 family integrating conjugative element protein [Vibrio barjaei]MCY9874548.1 TIGR03749 family integrating conjugative element protein [Vibrio barjaei]